MSLLSEIKSAQIPAHIAIIMDGNGRWAKQRNLPRTSGHKEGLEVAKKIVKAAKKVGVKYITLYTFSTENWKRTQEEVGYLMGLIKNHLRAEFKFYKENDLAAVHRHGVWNAAGSDLRPCDRFVCGQMQRGCTAAPKDLVSCRDAARHVRCDILSYHRS